MANLNQAIALCIVIERIAPKYGCHVALTGGCLYKEGERKDIDIIFYRIRQVEKIDHEGLFLALDRIGIEKVSGDGWCHKAKTTAGVSIDLLFPEADGGDYDEGESPLTKAINDLNTINSGAPEMDHIDANNILCQLLRDYGLGDAVDAFESADNRCGFWYG